MPQHGLDQLPGPGRGGDRISVPGAGLRVQRAALVGRGSLYIDTLKSHRARTVPLTARAAQIVETWAATRPVDAWIFASPQGAALRENNWKRQVRWNAAKVAIGHPTLRVHDLRHTAASLWLGSGADSKVVQRILGHASAAMTMDVYGHLIDRNLWEAAKQVGDRLGTATPNHTEENHG
jgi:integrase